MNRRGFSLLELLVALSLSVLLLAGIYAGLNLFWRYSTTGQEEVERAQIARAVLRLIEVDLRSVVYKLSSDSSGSGAGSGGSGGAGGAGGAAGGSAGGGASGAGAGAAAGIPSTPTTPTSGGSSSGAGGASGTNGAGGGSAAGQGGATGGSGGSGAGGAGAAGAGGTTTPAVEPAGLVGTSTTIKFTTCAPARRAEYVPFGTQVAGISRSSDLLTVGYQLGDSIDAVAADAVGLGRMEGDRLLLDQAARTGNTQILSSSLRIIATEVTALSFSYFDGYSWRSDWDSASLGGLPTAIEVVLDVTTQARGARPGSSPESRGSKTQTFRLTVAMPLSKATDTFAAQQ